jgi:hypothetical protein
MIYEPWNDPTRKRYYTIPLELAYEAVHYNVPIGETCRDALQRAIQEKRQRLYETIERVEDKGTS